MTAPSQHGDARLLERLIAFFVLGFVVFVADVGSWWSAGSLYDWYGNYLPWLLVIAACAVAAARDESAGSKDP